MIHGLPRLDILDLNLISLAKASRGKVLDLDMELTTQGSSNLTMALTSTLGCFLMKIQWFWSASWLHEFVHVL